jgi:hypothetical protein
LALSILVLRGNSVNYRVAPAKAGARNHEGALKRSLVMDPGSVLAVARLSGTTWMELFPDSIFKEPSLKQQRANRFESPRPAFAGRSPRKAQAKPGG